MNSRLRFSQVCLYLCGFVILGRLFYWQILEGPRLAAQAQDQRMVVETIDAYRGSILASDGFVLSANQDFYQLYAYKPQLKISHQEVAAAVAPYLLEEPKDATEAAIPVEQRLAGVEINIRDKLNHPERKWVPLWRDIDQETKDKIDELNIIGLGFDRYQRRYYPEASMSAHLLGFVGHDEAGNRKGYFGLEGYYDLELEGRPGRVIQERDAIGRPILIGFFDRWLSRQGRNIHLHLDRSIQHKVEAHLIDGIERYGAVSGEVLIMDPHTGAVIASASYPNYHPGDIGSYPTEYYKNPVIANAYEPGSTFKTLVMAAGIDAGVISPSTVCDSTCDGAVNISGYRIRTWDDQYFSGRDMTEVLTKSDNVGMIFVARQLGQQRFLDYINAFGFGELTQIDLQEEATARLRSRWSEIDIATASFGQGIAVTGVQMVQAISTIANGGNLMQPQIVAKVEDENRMIEIQPRKIRRVISPESAEQVTQMMVNSASYGEASWTVLKDYKIAGKTGTAQIPVDGRYAEDKTIASFIGFAPADDPKFAMIVKLQETTSSPWAAETAAPIWYDIARDLFLHYNIPPSR